MKQARRDRQHAAIRDEIKTTARAHMARDGAAALSLRAVASEMGLSSAAIYYYYPNRDALITDLIVDAFRALGIALRAADAAYIEQDVAQRLFQTMLAYRAWAVGNSAEFTLVFGTPIPGYQAPAEITAPEVRAAMRIFGQLFALAHAQGRLHFDTAVAPSTVLQHGADYLERNDEQFPLPVLLASLHAWCLGHGLVALEIDNHLQPIIGDPAAFFAYQTRALLGELGLREPSA